MKYSIVIECSSEEELKKIVNNIHLLDGEQPKSAEGVDLDDPRQLKEWVNKRKRELRYTNVALAEATGLSIQTIQNMLRPQPISQGTLHKVLDVLGE